MNKLTVILPAYNEERNILRGCLTHVVNWVRERTIPADILVVNDGSTDNTGPVSARYICRYGRVVTIDHAGKAAAVVAGLKEAYGDLVLIADFDQSTPIQEYRMLERAINDGYDFAIGSRGTMRHGAPPIRKLLSQAMSTARNEILGMPWKDTQCGFKLYDRRAALAVLQQMQVYRPDRFDRIQGPCTAAGFDVEFLYVAARLGYMIAEVPVVWHHQPSARVRPIHDAITGIQDLLRIRAAARRGSYPDIPGIAERLKAIA